jgi:hypothetical protein
MNEDIDEEHGQRWSRWDIENGGPHEQVVWMASRSSIYDTTHDIHGGA